MLLASSHAQDRIQRPDAGPAAAMTPVIVKRQLSNGLRVWIVEQHELPVVQMSLLVLAGTDADPPGRYGIASLTSAMLTEGAGSRSAVEIADALDALLANLSASSGVDSSSLQLYVPVAAACRGAAADGRRGAAADVSDAGARDACGSSAWSRCATRATIRTRSRPWRSRAAVYGPSHRSAAALIGTADSIKALDARGSPRLSRGRLPTRTTAP